MRIPMVTVIWASRLLLGEEPRTAAEIRDWQRAPDELALCQRLIAHPRFDSSGRRAFLLEPGLSRNQTEFAPQLQALSSGLAAGVTPEEIRWGYRLILGRNPESDQAIAAHSKHSNRLELVHTLLRSKEFTNGTRRQALLGLPAAAP
jgi:hypothetical protein